MPENKGYDESIKKRNAIMKKTKAMLIALVLFTMASVCWGQSYWTRTYGGMTNDDGIAITPTSDGNFIVAGNTNSSDVYLLKIKPNGDTIWTKTYGRSGDAGITVITPIPDGNFFVAVRTNYFGTDSFADRIYDIYLLKIKPNGDTLWTKTYRGSNWASAITPTPDGNFLITGNTDTWFEIHDIHLFKINPNGDTLWTKTYHGSGNDLAYAITPTSDGNFIVAGGSSIGGGPYDVYLLKIKPNGDTLWTKTYGGNYDDFAVAITPTSDGNFVIAGCTYWSDGGDVYLLKIKQNGDTLWTKTYGGTGDDVAFAITPTVDGNFIVVGYSESLNAYNYDVYLLKIKPNGDTLWTKKFGGASFYDYAITPTPDGNFIVAGYTVSSELWLLSIIDDRYAYKNSLFTFKIPVSGDSLNHGYTPLIAPSGMTVSLGGTISWTPTTDSVYMDHVEFLVADDFGNKDTLTFNIFVNSSYKPTLIKPVSRFIVSKNQPFSISQILPSQIKFNVPSDALSLDIYDMRGRQVQHITPSGSTALWNKTNSSGTPVPAGKYFAKIKEGTGSREQGFMVVR